MQTFLEDIRQLDQRGDHEAALELADLWLDEHPQDADARLLKAHICLNGQKNYRYVGQVLLDSTRFSAEALDVLRRRSADLAWALVAEGRERLRSRYPDEALEDFDNALALLPTDPVIPLAAGLALARIRPPAEPNPSPFSEQRRRLNPDNLNTQIEKYLRRVLAGDPDARAYEVAVTTLVRHWLAQDRLTSEALALLAGITTPSPATVELLAELGARVQALALDTIASLLRMDVPDKADLLLKLCRREKISGARLALYEAERWIGDKPEKALAACRRALASAKRHEEPVGAAAAQTLLLAVQGLSVSCPACGKATRPNAGICAFCETSLVQRALWIDSLPDAPDITLAQAGIAELLARAGRREAALASWQAAHGSLPPDHAAHEPLRALYRRLFEANQPVESPVDDVVRALREPGVGAELLLQVGHVNQSSPEAWAQVDPKQRARLVRRLIDAGELWLAHETLAAAFAGGRGQVLVAPLNVLLDGALNVLLDGALRQTLSLIAAGQPDEAVAASSEALALAEQAGRQDAPLLRARGDAHRAAGRDLLALDDYFAASNDSKEHDAARKAAALVLERRWDVAGALALLDSLDEPDAEVGQARARLERRARGEPVVLTERVGEGVMDDTLTRRVQPPYYQGYFALAVREVAALRGDGEAWIDKLLAASGEFVQVLGALRDMIGGAVFALRTISRPHRLIPERGSVTVALLARVSAPDAVECRARALQLWTDVQAVLPLAQENVYVYEPVVDEGELQALLTPFEVGHAAEITHADFEIDGSPAAIPFLSGSVDLHRLHWALLRQSAPAMLSIHLKPTSLLPWEQPQHDEADGADVPLTDGDRLLPPATDRLYPNGARVQLWEKLQRVRVNRLSAAFVLRIYVAGGSGASQLLPEMAAAALFEPLRSGGAGYGIERAGSPQEFDVIVRNLSALDVESWTRQTGRLRYLVGETEAAQVFRLPIPNADGVPGMPLLEGKPLVPPVGMPEHGVRFGVSSARVQGVPLPITQSEEDRRRHLYVVGKTGMGKSTLLLGLILQDIEAGRGVFLLDPHGDLCDDVLARIPAARQHDVILLDPSDDERPIGLNILEAETEADQHRVVNEFIGLLTRLYDPHNQAVVGPIFQQSVRNAMLAAMALPDGGTLIDVYRLLADGRYVRQVLPHVTDPLVRTYWEEIAARVESSASSPYKAEMLPYILSKFSRFVEDSTLRRMIGQPRTSIPWRSVMDDGKILLVNLAKGRIGQENAQFVGSLVLSSVLQAAFRRGEMPAARRREFYIYIDEVQNYTTPLLGTMLSEGRKFGVILTVANQFLHQLDNGIREAVFGNVGSLVAFRVGAQDAPALVPEFSPVFSPADLLNLPQYTACVKLLIGGAAARPFTMRTLPAMLPPNEARARQIREASRQRYGTDIATVQAEILRRF